MKKPGTAVKTAGTMPLATLCAALTGCGQPPEHTSFGVDATMFDCSNGSCEVTFRVNNQAPHRMPVRYRAVLFNSRNEPVAEFSERIELPEFELTSVARTIPVAESPERLRVTVITQQGL